ncbi:MAG: FAD:protein FMN transferase [Bacteroidia bacterium]
MQSVKLFFLLLCVCFWGCQPEAKYVSIAGETMGTTYHVTYRDSLNRDLQSGVDSVLKVVNQSMSTYIPTSLISQFNQSSRGILMDQHFKTVFAKALEVAANTGGAFDPTVAPLVNAWGFGFKKQDNVDSAMIDSLMAFVGYEKVQIKGDSAIKLQPEVMLDFSAIAKGYGVDAVAAYLESNGISNFMVEIGGEVMARGRNSHGQWWTIKILRPADKADQTSAGEAVASLADQALATSGNYQQFYEKDGRRYSHTINPETGWSVEHNLLSASVIAPDCMTADAYATAFMVMGKEKALQYAERQQEVQVFLIFENEDKTLETFLSEDLKDQFDMLE